MSMQIMRLMRIL